MWLEQLSEGTRERARYQEMAAKGLIDFEKLRARLSSPLVGSLFFAFAGNI